MSGISLSTTSYRNVSIVLFTLLVVTLVLAELHLGPLAWVAALVIACAKTVLVAVYFMHLRFATPLTRVFALAGVVWYVILLGLTLGDVLTRAH